jgi:hypothetical protein
MNIITNIEINAREKQEDPIEKADTVNGSEKEEQGNINSDKEFKELKR